MASSRKLTLTILGNAKGAVGALASTQTSAEKFASSMGSVGKKVGIGLAAIGASAIYMGKQLVDAAYASQKVTKQTEAIIKSTGSAANVTAGQIGKLSQKLSVMTGIDDEAIQSSANLLLTFKAIKNQAGQNNNIFDQTTQAVLDMGAVFGSSDAAAIQLGKALSDPIKGVTALKKSGIDFTEAQKAQIASMVKTGDLLGAQKLILKEVESQVGGTAAAMSTDFDRAKVAVGNVAEDLGGLLLPSLEQASRFITDQVTPAISGLVDIFKDKGLSGVFDELGRQIQEKAPIVIQKIGELLSTAFAWIRDSGVPLARQYLGFLANVFVDWIQPMIPIVIQKMVDYFKKLGDWTLNTGLPWLVKKTEKLGDVFVEWVSNAASDLGPKLVNFLKVIAEWTLQTAIPKLLELGGQLLQSLLKWTVQLGWGLLKGLGGALVALTAALPELFGAFMIGLGKIAVNAVQWFVDKFMGLKDKLAQVAINVVNFLIDTFNKIPLIPNIPRIEIDTKKLGETMGLTGAQLETVNAKFDGVSSSAKKAGSEVETLNLNTGGLKQTMGATGQTTDKAKQQLDAYVQALKGMTSAQKAATEAGKGVIKANSDLLKANIALEEAQKRFNQAVSGYGAGSKEATSRQDQLDKAQRDVERAGYGVESALFAVTQAEIDLQDVRNKEGSTPQEIREAEIRLAESKLSVKDAIDQQKQSVLDQAEAERQLDIAVNGVKEGTAEYKTVLDDLTEAQDRQRDAIDNVTEAREREAEAIDKVREAEEKLAEVRKKTPAGIIAQGNAKVATKPVPAVSVPDVTNPLDPFFLDLFSGLDLSNVGSFGMTGTPAQNVTNINVTAGIGDPNAIASEVVSYMKLYERNNGYIPITAQYLAV